MQTLRTAGNPTSWTFRWTNGKPALLDLVVLRNTTNLRARATSCGGNYTVILCRDSTVLVLGDDSTEIRPMLYNEGDPTSLVKASSWSGRELVTIRGGLSCRRLCGLVTLCPQNFASVIPCTGSLIGSESWQTCSPCRRSGSETLGERRIVPAVLRPHVWADNQLPGGKGGLNALKESDGSDLYMSSRLL
eukprot:755029-Hanusia_phi.AAC.14